MANVLQLKIINILQAILTNCFLSIIIKIIKVKKMSIALLKSKNMYICTYRIDSVLIKKTYKNTDLQSIKFDFAEYCLTLMFKYQ